MPAYDINRHYTKLHRDCDSYGWPKYEAMDTIEVFDGSIATGVYYIKTTEFCGNGWYSDSVVDDLLYDNII